MTRRFTPPPWNISDSGMSVYGQSNRPWIAVTADGRSEVERKANVHLIAVAPELYELGERAVALFEESLALILESHCLLNDQLQPIRDTLEDDVRDAVERLERDIAAARALLAKALGEKLRDEVR